MFNRSTAQTSHRRTPAGIATATMLIAAGSTFVASTAAATTVSALPDALYEIQIGGTTTDYATPGDYRSGGERVTTTNTPSPSSKTTVSGDGSARGYVRYSWQLDGPAGVSVPVIVSGHLDVSSAAPNDGQANATASLLWNSGLFTDTAYLEIDRGGFNNSAPTHADPTFRELVTTGSGGLIILDTTVGARKGSGIAFADPVFSIDPAFASVDPGYLSHYSFSFSPGIGNSSDASGSGGITTAVPEPASWALLLGGVAAIGTLTRRRLRA